VTSHQAMRQAARRSALDAQAYCARNVPKRPTHARLAIRQRSGGHHGRRRGRGALHLAGRPWEDDAFTERAMLTA
jgi:hypothetical protein